MTEEVLDTQDAPADGGDGSAPTTEPEDTGDQVQSEPTPEQLEEQRWQEREERLLQKFQSWTGRRETELLRKIEALSARQKEDVPAGFDFENPEGSVARIVQDMHRREQAAAQEYNGAVVTKAAEIMEGDAALKDQEFAKEVLAEIKAVAPTLRRSNDPEDFAEKLVYRAKANVAARKIGKKNPFAGRTPTNTAGTISPGHPKADAPKPVKISETARQWADKWGYSDDDIRKVLGK